MGLFGVVVKELQQYLVSKKSTVQFFFCNVWKIFKQCKRSVGQYGIFVA